MSTNQIQLSKYELMNEHWSIIKNWLKEYIPELFLSLGAPAQDEKIIEFEKIIGRELPLDYKMFLKIHNGESSSQFLFIEGYQFGLYSIPQIFNEIKQVEARKIEIRQEFIASGIIYSKTSLAIGYDGGGSYLWLDLLSGKITLVLHYVEETIKMSSFSELLAYNASLYQNNKILVLSREDTSKYLSYATFNNLWEELIKFPEFEKSLNFSAHSVESTNEQNNTETIEVGKSSIEHYLLVTSLSEDNTLGSYYELPYNIHWSLYYKYNGQKNDDTLFTDGEHFFKFLSYSEIQNERIKSSTIIYKCGKKLLPIFANPAEKTALFVEIYRRKMVKNEDGEFIDITQRDERFYLLKDGEIKQTELEFTDILSRTLIYYKAQKIR